jgi:hypothetical protein
MIEKPTRPGPKRPKVVSINSPTREAPDRPRVIASDPSTQRVILAIGRQRIAYDFTTRITRLPPTTGDQPAGVLPMKSSPVNKHTRDNGSDAA